ncbi:AlpA family transcriptional regulator [Crenobacter sp. SG2305]|uniref:helix-turn-helix transcriptional regulator n=1 Tax=Crenobacter oryzisoli TaxID=3056844 RepID=UPI0025AAB09F|nr:AlpA family transcriptional regulator [Crenobacter sp. SG2305]MDN0082056.1 AlpA family transcriptional regulator [Crenobacter sp. SG2305]
MPTFLLQDEAADLPTFPRVLLNRNRMHNMSSPQVQPANSGNNQSQQGTLLPFSGERFLRLPAVMALTGLARSTIYLHIKNGTFPAPVKLGGNSVAWLASEVGAWMADCITNRGRAA